MKTGDRVICVSAHSDPRCSLKKGKEYVVNQIKKCECEEITFDVGITGSAQGGCFCGQIYANNGIWWFSSKRFRKVEYRSAHSELTNVVEEKLDVPVTVT
jgi:hypothetical protein